MDSKVLDILEEYLAWEKMKESKKYSSLAQEEKDELRLRYDGDAAYYYKTLGIEKDRALCADTIISFWTIYKKLLELEADWSAFKTVKSLERLIFQTKKTRRNDYTENIRKVNENLEEFAAICYSNGNYMLLPVRKMNIMRYEVTEDRIDLTLFECFGGGKLSACFKNDEAVKMWVLEQKLDLLFKNRKVDRNNIKWFLQDNMKKISAMSKNEIYQYLGEATQMMKERSSQLQYAGT